MAISVNLSGVRVALPLVRPGYRAGDIPMAVGKGKWWGQIALVVLVVLIAGGIVGFRVAVGVMKGKVVEALGPDSEITGISRLACSKGSFPEREF